MMMSHRIGDSKLDGDFRKEALGASTLEPLASCEDESKSPLDNRPVRHRIDPSVGIRPCFETVTPLLAFERLKLHEHVIGREPVRCVEHMSRETNHGSLLHAFRLIQITEAVNVVLDSTAWVSCMDEWQWHRR